LNAVLFFRITFHHGIFISQSFSSLHTPRKINQKTMCTRAFTYHLRCGHSTFKDVNTRGCHLYHREEHFCPRNHDKIKHDADNICKKCTRSLRDSSVNLAFKIVNFGNVSSSCSSSGYSTSSSESFPPLDLPATVMPMEERSLGSIMEDLDGENSPGVGLPIRQ
jgi:hypothetical protein